MTGRPAPSEEHRVTSLDATEDGYTCTCGRTFVSEAGWAICPGDLVYWTGPADSPDALLHRMLRMARQRTTDPLALDLLTLHELLAARYPFPTAWAEDRTGPPQETVYLPGDEPAASIRAAAVMRRRALAWLLALAADDDPDADWAGMIRRASQNGARLGAPADEAEFHAAAGLTLARVYDRDGLPAGALARPEGDQ